MATVTAADISYQAANESAKQQMEFQKMMSDTAHAREVADLKAAGLNPVLSAHGQGAQVTAGAAGYVGDENAKKFDEQVAQYELEMKELEMQQALDLLREQTNAKVMLKSLDQLGSIASESVSGKGYSGNGSSGKGSSGKGSSSKSSKDKKTDTSNNTLFGTLGNKLLNNKDKGVTGIVETALGYLANKYGNQVSNYVANKINGRITNKPITGGKPANGGFGHKVTTSNLISRGNGRNTSSNPIASARKNLNTLIKADATRYSYIR